MIACVGEATGRGYEVVDVGGVEVEPAFDVGLDLLGESRERGARGLPEEVGKGGGGFE